MKWDLYDKNFNYIGKTIEESQCNKIPNNLYHMTINLWIINSKKQVLLTKKIMNFNLRYPGLWTGLNGNVNAGETPVDCAKRIVEDKIGLKLNDDNLTEISRDLRDPYHYIYITFVVKLDIDLTDLTLNNNFVTKVKWADLTEVENMINNGEMEMPLVSRIDKYIKPYL